MKPKGYSTIACSENLSKAEIKQWNLDHYGSKIKAFRIRARLSAERLAGMLQTTLGSIRNWECGLSRPDVEQLYRMFSILDVEPNEFFGIKGVGNLMTNREKGLIDIYRGLDKQSRNDLEAMAETLASQSYMRKLKSIYNRIDTIPYYGRCASADTKGEEWADYPEEEQILLYASYLVSSADEIITVSGDSMMPQFLDGDKVLVEHCTEIQNGDIGIFYVPGIGGVIKQKAYDRLHSLNPEYDDIFPHEHGAHLIGRVLAKINKSMVPGYQEIKMYEDAEAERNKDPEAFDAFDE